MPYPRIREAIESSSAAVLHAVAAALSDAWYQPAAADGPEARLVQSAARLPDAVVRWLVGRNVRDSGLDPVLSRYVTSEGLARQAVSVYGTVADGVGYPAILIGAPNGGAAYLAALMQVPFLPSHFVLGFADPTSPDDILTYQAHGAEIIEPILKRNPDLLAVNHYDPVHHRFLVEHVNQVRLKLLDLPEAYRNFIRAHLAPDGALLCIDCSYTWRQYQIGPQHFFQVGGLGGYDAQQFLTGDAQLNSWLAAQGSKHVGGWKLGEDVPQVEARESEWGTPAGFREAVQRFAHDSSYAFHGLNGSNPEDFSALAYTAYLWEARLHERQPGGLLIECYSQINPTAALRSDLLPLWLPFNCSDSLLFLENMLDFVPEGLPVVLSMLSTFSSTPDMPDARAWQEAVARVGKVQWIGPDPKRYPADLMARSDYLPQLQTWTRDRPGRPPQPRLRPEELLQMVRLLSAEGPGLIKEVLHA